MIEGNNVAQAALGRVAGLLWVSVRKSPVLFPGLGEVTLHFAQAKYLSLLKMPHLGTRWDKRYPL